MRACRRVQHRVRFLELAASASDDCALFSCAPLPTASRAASCPWEIRTQPSAFEHKRGVLRKQRSRRKTQMQPIAQRDGRHRGPRALERCAPPPAPERCHSQLNPVLGALAGQLARCCGRGAGSSASSLLTDAAWEGAQRTGCARWLRGSTATCRSERARSSLSSQTRGPSPVPSARSSRPGAKFASRRQRRSTPAPT